MIAYGGAFIFAPIYLHEARGFDIAGTATLVLLIDDVDRNALVAEAARFTGAELVQTTLDSHTMHRIDDALRAQPPGTSEAALMAGIPEDPPT